MPISANVTINCCIEDSDGDPVQSAVVTLRLNTFDQDGGCFVAPEDLTGTTDAQGECTIDAWPNTAGELGTYYTVSAVDASGATILSGVATVPDADNLLLTDLLEQTVDTPLVLDRRNLTLFTGYDFEAEFTVTQPDGSTAFLDAYTLVMKVYNSQGGTLQFDSSVDSGFTLTGAGDTLTVEITLARVATITSGWYYTIDADDGVTTFPLTYGTLYKQ